MATMKDVARAAGVSTYTVSAALSGSAYVSPELKARVSAAVAALGYERNSMAQSLKRGMSSLIGLIVSDVTNPFFTEFVASIQNEARQAGYSVLLGVSGHDLDSEEELLGLMRSHQAAGTILCPAGGERDYPPARLPNGKMKVVAADNAAPELGVDTVTLDNLLAAEMAVRHLLSLGHRRIGTVAGFAHQHVSRQRLQGYGAALQGAGLDADPALISHGNFRIEDARAACKRLLGLRERPSALFVANNLMLIGVMQALSDLGVRVPQDISVCSIDDFPWASAFQPALTVVRQPIAAMAAAALSCLRSRLEGDRQPVRHLVFAPELVIRQSSAAIG